MAMKSTRKTSAQRMSNGTYRVGSSRSRSAISGRFVSKGQAKGPATAVPRTRAQNQSKG